MTSEKEYIHTLTIKRSGEQHLFEIKLPKNATKITGLHISVQPSTNPTTVPVNNATSQLFSLEQVIY